MDMTTELGHMGSELKVDPEGQEAQWARPANKMAVFYREEKLAKGQPTPTSTLRTLSPGGWVCQP